MRVIVARMPRIEAALLRFDTWWTSRSPRERVLLGVLAALLGGVVLVYGVIKPIQSTRAQAFADIRTYETYMARLRAAGTLAPAHAPRTGEPAQVISGAATSYGIVANVEPVEGGLRATIADASYESILAWLADLGASSPLVVRGVTIQRRPNPGAVSATVEFGA